MVHSSSEALNRWLADHLATVTQGLESTEATSAGEGDSEADAAGGSGGVEAAASTGAAATVSGGGTFIGVGGVICVVDFPPAHAVGSGRGTALWRRLLLGEGDGGAMRGSNQVQGQGAYYSVGSILGYGISTFLGSNSNSSSSVNYDGRGDVSSDPTLADKDGEESYSANCDPQSIFADAERMALLEVSPRLSHDCYHTPF